MPSAAKLGKRTLNVEIQGVSKNALWLWVRGQEYLLPFSEYPWFKNATIADICNVELIHDDHLHWPALDVDLDLDSLIDPEKYPLAYH